MNKRTKSIWLLVAAVLLTVATATVDARVDYPTEEWTTGVTAVDLNGDSAIDIAAAVAGPDGVAILINNGDGTYQVAVDYLAGGGSNSIVAALFDNNASFDLAVAHGSSDSAVSILLNNGDGTFMPAQRFATLVDPRSICAADFDGDGSVDLAFIVGLETDPKLQLLFGDNTGGFGGSIYQPLDSMTKQIVAADFDNDGFGDIAALGRWYFSNPYHEPVWILISNGDGSFQAPLFPPGLMHGGALAVGDINGDVYPDLVIATDDWDVCFGMFRSYENDGAGVMSYGPGGAIVNDMPRTLLATDFNSDGYADYAVGMTCGGDIHIFVNDRDTALYDPIILYDANYGTSQIVVADIDNDGDPDLISANGDIAVFETLKTGGACCRGIRGNVDYDPNDQIDITDVVALVDFMFQGGPPPICVGEANISGDGEGGSEPWGIDDLVYLVDYMFTGGPPPPPCLIFAE